MGTLKLKIDAVEYDFPKLDTLTLDECILLEKYGGKGIEELEGESLPMGAIKALAIIGVMRVRTDASEKEIAKRIGEIKLTELNDVIEADASPPADSPPTKTSEDPESSGDSGNGAGDHTPEKSETPGATGSPDSDTGFTSFHRTSVG